MQGAVWRQMLCANVADFSGCASLSIAGTSRRGEHLAGHKIMRGKGEAREKGECKQLFVYFFSLSLVNLWVTCVCLWGVCACVLQLALLERMSICLSRPFCFGFLAPPALRLSISVQASGT